MGIDLDKYRKAVNTPDRVDTGYKDKNGDKIKVGDVLETSTGEMFCVNKSPNTGEFFGLGKENKIMRAKKFKTCTNYGVAIFNSDAKEIFS